MQDMACCDYNRTSVVFQTPKTGDELEIVQVLFQVLLILI